MNSSRMEDTFQKALKGDKFSIARVITIFERARPTEIPELLGKLRRESNSKMEPGNPHIVSLVGPPGAGKSSTISQLSRILAKDSKLMIMAIDPSSEVTGGSILGNVIRMVKTLNEFPNIFARSFPSGNVMGGLFPKAAVIVEVMRLLGFDYIILEGVGSGHLDINPFFMSHTRVVVTTPAGGDLIQLIKAGIMEFGDIYVVNKSDYANAAEFRNQLLEAVYSERSFEGWECPIISSVAKEGKGMDELASKIKGHMEWMNSSAVLLEREAGIRKQEVKQIFNDLLGDTVSKILDGGNDRKDPQTRGLREFLAGSSDLESVIPSLAEIIYTDLKASYNRLSKQK